MKKENYTYIIKVFVISILMTVAGVFDNVKSVENLDVHVGVVRR